MNDFFEVIKYVIPALVVFITAYTLIRLFLDDVKNARPAPVSAPDKNHLLETETQKIMLPLKLQACERLTLFMERISPESLIMRNHRSGMTATDMQRELLKNIREEFEHNLSQQIYIHTSTWEAVRTAKDEMTKLAKLAGSQTEGSASALAYSETLLKMAGQLQMLPTQIAIEKIKQELR